MERKCENEYLCILLSLYLFNPPIIDCLHDKALLTIEGVGGGALLLFYEAWITANLIYWDKVYPPGGIYFFIETDKPKVRECISGFIDPLAFWTGSGANVQGHDSRIFHLFMLCSPPLAPSSCSLAFAL